MNNLLDEETGHGLIVELFACSGTAAGRGAKSTRRKLSRSRGCALRGRRCSCAAVTSLP